MRGELYFAKADGRLAPAEPEAEEALSRIGAGEIVGVRLNKGRNARFNRKYRALVRAVFDAAGGHWRSPEDLHVELKIRTGQYVEHLTANGELVYVPDSTAFDKMDETAFAEFYERVIQLICTDVVPGLEEADLRRFIEEQP